MSSNNFKPYRHTSSYYRKVKKILKGSLINTTVNILNDSAVTQTATSPVISVCNCTENSQPFHESLSEDFKLDDSAVHESAEEGDQNCYDSKLNFLQDLQQWALLYRLPHSALNELLKLLRCHGFEYLPKDSRTLLSTPRTTAVTEMSAGHYWYNGLKSNLTAVLSDNIQKQRTSTLSLIFNIDGISPFKSSPLEFWPILFAIDEYPGLKPMVAAIYYGHGKPPLEPYLTPLVNELIDIINNGLEVNTFKINVKIKFFVCDSPARSFIKGVVGFNAADGCLKCTVVGEWDKRGHHMSFPRIHCPRRSDESFRNRVHEEHHKQDTPLEKLPINMIEDIIVSDSLHLFDLGVMRKCLYGWCQGSYNFRTKLSAAEINSLSLRLEEINTTKPVEIQRAVRGLKFLKYWKGAEFRTLVLYVGVVVLKDFLPNDVYEHFLMLSCAVTILSCKEYCNKYLHIAEILLNDYVEMYINLYGIDSVSMNVHNLCHVVEDVKKCGPLPGISSYPFENFLGYLKSLVRSGKLPLSQISRRVIELSKLMELSFAYKPFATHVKGEVHCIPELNTCDKAYRKLYITESFMLSNNSNNKWFLTKNNEIVSMQSATYLNGEFHVYGRALRNKYDFFTKPLHSSNLNIYASNGETTAPILYSIKNIRCKLFSMKYHDEFVFLPLIHTFGCSSSFNSTV